MTSTAAPPLLPFGNSALSTPIIPSGDDAVSLTDVTKRFGKFLAVNRLSLHVPAGQVMGFLGPNGAGKTTTIRMIMSILYPDSGQVRVLGHERAVDVKDRIGYLPEERGLYRKMSVYQTLHYLGRLKGLRGALLKQRVLDGLESVGLGDWRKHRVEALSKGMQQKLQFVATMLHRPELVILDEPFSGLDPLNVDLLQRQMLELRRQQVTVIFSTHQMETAERLCDRIVLIDRGSKVIEGTLHDVRQRFSARMVTLEGDGDFSRLAQAPGVVDAHFTAGHARLELTETADPHEVLRLALGAARVTRFEMQRPSLQEIFVKLVGREKGECGAGAD